MDFNPSACATKDRRYISDRPRREIDISFSDRRKRERRQTVLQAYLSFSEALAGGAFDGATREAIALAVARENRCDYCASAHSAIAKSLKVDGAEIDRNLAGRSVDPRLSAILAFATAVVEKRGLVTDADFAAARQAGLSDAEISEVVGNVAHNLFTNYFNHVAETEIDFPVVRTGQQDAA